MKKKRQLKIPQGDCVMKIQTNYLVYNWCCDCNLRHISHYRIERGKTPDEDLIIITSDADRIATKLRRFYEKH